MSYANRYRIPILNPGVATQDDSMKLFCVVIQERDYTGAETVLKGTSSPCILSYRNESEEKYPSITASEVEVSFYSEDNFSLESIISDDDFQFKVLITEGQFNGSTFDEQIIWVGFLSTDDCHEEAQDDPRRITLKATDGIGFLKNQPLYDLDVYEKQDLHTIIRRCLSFTNTELGILIEVNVYEENMYDRDDVETAEPLSQCEVHTRSFLEDAENYMNCYDVLDRVLTGFKATLFQQDGRWIIQRKHDRWNQEMNYGTYRDIIMTWAGLIQVPVPIILKETNDYRVAIDNVNMHPITADHIKSYVSPVKHSKIIYRFKQPDSLPRNANFQQGQVFETRTNEITNHIAYWSWQEPDGTPITTNVPYRKRVLSPETGQEEESYIVLRRKNPSTNMEVNRIVSEPVEVIKGDRLHFTADTRTKNNYSGSTTESVMALVIYGDDGSIWSYRKLLNNAAYDDDEGWRSPFTSVIQRTLNSGENATDWFQIEFRTKPFPVSGDLVIMFFNTTASVTGNERWFKNINFDWQFFINGTTRINGVYDKITQNKSHRSVLEQETYIGDSPNKVINGALFLNSDDTVLTKKWHRAGKNELVQLQRINDICLYQSRYRLYTRIDGSFLGITYSRNSRTRLIGPANLFSFPNTQLASKQYLATNLSINLGANTFSATLQEFYDSTKDNGDPQGDNQLYKYIYE